MKGSVSKYGASGRVRWRYRLHLKDARGGNLWEGKSGFKKQSEASEALRIHITELQSRANAAAPSPGPVWTLQSWLDHWLDHYGPTRCQPKTLERYRQLAGYLNPDLGKVPLTKLTHTDLETALFVLLKGPGKRRAHLSAKTVHHVAGLINVTLNKAFKLGLIPVNPMLRVELPPIERTDARSLSTEEIQALRQACQGDWTFALIELSLASGARRGELLALTWPDVDWLARSLRIDKSLEQTREGLRVKRPKSGVSAPSISPCGPRVSSTRQQEAKRLFGSDYQDNGLIFCQPHGGFLEPDLVSQIIIRRVRKAGIKDASFHSLRHTHASTLLSRGVPLSAISAHLGHSVTNVTARVYSHALPADDDRAADAWDALIDGPKTIN
jgi:integrase